MVEDRARLGSILGNGSAPLVKKYIGEPVFKT
jgi:hypothetical protein